MSTLLISMAGGILEEKVNMTNTKSLATVIEIFTAVFLCMATRASVQFVGTSGSYAASDSQLAGGQTLTEWTLELWVKPANTNSYQGLFNNTPVEPWKELSMSFNQGIVGFLEAWPNSYYSVSSPSGFIPQNQWTLVSVVGDPSGLLLYVNGVQKGSGPSPGQASFASTHSPNTVGAFSFGLEDFLTLPDAGFFQGYMADFRVWDRALPSSEILSHVTGEPAVDAAGLRNWIPFNETTGTQFHDIVSGVTGTLYGATFSADSPVMVQAPAQVQTLLTNGLVAYYPFNGNANDQSGNANNGAVFGATLAADRFGNPNSAYSFNGLSDYISVADAPSLNPPNAISVSAWIKAAESRTDGGIVTKQSTAGSQWLIVEQGGGSTGVPEYYGGMVGLSGLPPQLLRADFSTPHVDGLWHHFMMIYDGSVVSLYEDGNVVASKSGGLGTLAVLAQPVEIGRDQGGVHGSQSLFSGLIDDVRIYNRALSSSEVAQLYAYEATSPLNSVTNGLVAYYPFNGNANDESGNGNNGTVVGATLTSDRFGKSNSAYRFGGSHIDIPVDLNRKPLTFTAWFNTERATGYPSQFIVGNQAFNTPNQAVAIDWHTNVIIVDSQNAQSQVTTDFHVVPDTWYQVTVSYSEKVRAFINGSKILEIDYPVVPKSINPTSWIGDSQDAVYHGPFYGAIDDVRIYNRALSDTEVQNLYAYESQPAPVPITITGQPQSQTVNPGAIVTFGVTATGTPPLTYQWKFNGTPMSGATSSALTLNGTSSANAGSYTVDVSNVVGTVTSGAALLVVNTPASIVQQPGNVNAVAGNDVTLQVTAAGTGPLTYLWKLNGTPIAGATSATLLLKGVSSANAGSYTVDVSNMLGTVTSDPAVLIVLLPPTIVQQPLSLTVFSGDQVTLSVQATGTAPLNYQWFKGGAAIPSGTDPSWIIPSAFFSNAGTYTVVVSNPYGTQGSEPAILTVKAVPNIVIHDQTPGGGIVMRDPFQSSFPPNSVVTLSAKPNDGWTFLDWKDNAQGTNPVVQINVNYAKSVRARFGTPITLLPSANGTVTVDPQAPLYPYDTPVRIVATPQDGSYFVGWSGSATGDVNPLPLLVRDANAIISASFLPLPAGKVALTVVPDGNGKVSVGPRANLFTIGQTVTNTALPDPGQDFLGWTGDAQGLENPLVLAMDRRKNITAQFTRRPHLDLEMSGKDGALLTLTGEFTGAYDVLRSSDLVGWSQILTLTNAYGEAQTMDPALDPCFCYKAVEVAPLQPTATAVPTVVNGFVVAITVTDGGDGYTAAPQVTITGGGGSGAVATATVLAGKVDKVIVVNAGSGYTGTPAVLIAPPGP